MSETPVGSVESREPVGSGDPVESGDRRADDRVREMLRTKRDGGALAASDSEWLLERTGRGLVPDEQLAALLSSIWFQGMQPAELGAWTRAMVASGDVLGGDNSTRPRVDKHSTGGIGDKVSLVLAPALAAMGLDVPMISGRGLGHTGGTLDKLESVPGVRTGLDEGEINAVLREAHCVICAQTERIAPADRVLYALRDRIELVASMPLIVSSIMSKKIAEGIDALVLDVKVGSGAFMREPDRARELAQAMTDLGCANGVKTSARLTWMGRPLGRAAGHTLEIAESRETLAGNGPADLAQITRTFAIDLGVESGMFMDEAGAGGAYDEAIASGTAAEIFERMLRAQGANGQALPRAAEVFELRAQRSGVLAFGELTEVGYAIRDLGGGRTAPGEPLDHTVGLEFQAVAGDRVDEGDVLCFVHHASGRGLDASVARLRAAMPVLDTADATSEPPLVIERILPKAL